MNELIHPGVFIAIEAIPRRIESEKTLLRVAQEMGKENHPACSVARQNIATLKAMMAERTGAAQ